MSKKVWIATGIVAAAVGVTALVAHAERGRHGDRGFGGHHSDWRGGERGNRGWRGRSHRETTREEFDSETRSKFAKWDANADGVVDATEVEAGLARRMEGRHRRRGGRRMERMLRRYDTDRDGKVTKAEIEALVAERFQRMDLTTDGRITDDDLPPIMRGMNILSGETKMGGHHRSRRGHRGGRRGHRHGGRMMRHVIGADTNKDGAVTLQEMQDRSSQRFARFDRNKDGVIDQADGDALRKEMIDYRVLRFMHRYGAADGKLTLEQFTKQRGERFAKHDVDGNGTIERHEMRGGRRGQGGHHRWGGRGRDGDRDRGGRSERRGDGGERQPEKRDTQ